MTDHERIIAEWEKLGGTWVPGRGETPSSAIGPDGEDWKTGGWGVTGLLTHCQALRAKTEDRPVREPAHWWADYVRIEGLA